ncbi:MAG: primosomal protein N' [Deltaproteobacteria bacterium]|nr:primosomal protein N' [Deltaproteobacteria bacterium]MBW1908843.1 primosomal protein N' [Deltaproteobacteria bacterium]MBW2033148.1 primosomal protein N' [Deltaproteobacteria bacterium]MBW2114206.1 primosomal protein N' [Deltaproteobacteria bacterium]MBW2169029.1 primosomal protein N' [Deltaproteobacteria bacterium]
MNDDNLSCLKIAVSVPVKGTFSYLVPERLVPQARVGCRVLVPFHNRKVTGYILEKLSQDHDQGIKEILDILDAEPLFHKQLVPFFEWMADYYMHPIGQVIQSALPGGINTNPFNTAFLTEKGSRALDSLTSLSQEREILTWIKDHPGKRFPQPLKNIYPLQKKGWLVIEDRQQKRRAGPLRRRFVKPTAEIDLKSVLEERGRSSKAKNEVEFLTTVFNSGPILFSELTARFSNGSYLVHKWTKNGALESYTGPVYRSPAGTSMFPSSVPSELYGQQRRALSRIKSFIDKQTFHVCLLYGVTGSGKTEVYYRAVEHAIGAGKQAIVMVPEISLALYMEGIFRSRLGNRVAVYHSRLSGGERYDEWMRMVRGEVDLVIGARSALFVPLSRLGLIVVDEEYDSAYKQENSPRYQARDAAVVRAKMDKALVILGAGTPSVQSFQNAASGRYHLLSMPDRIEKRPLPDVEIVDMKAIKGGQSRDEILSPKLVEALDKNLVAGNQTILFLNRRGFRSLYLCRSCGQSIRCPNCEVALTYHLEGNRLVCHYCGFHSETRLKCPSCGRKGVKAYGFGTEKLEQELKDMFPEARVARMDTDSTRKKGQAIQILRKFSRHEIDILVGTQMITKGYDFPRVTLVGVIAADLSLGFPDFRAGERTFQILSQVAGRAGRGDQRGKVIIQTFNPDHYAVHTATVHDYRSFFEKEKELREQLSYPPFSHLVCLRLKGNNKGKTEKAAQRLSADIRDILAGWPKRGKEIQVLGPVEAPISRLKGKYRWQILIKSKSVSLLKHLLTGVEKSSRKVLQSSGVHLILDVDPYQMI